MFSARGHRYEDAPEQLSMSAVARQVAARTYFNARELSARLPRLLEHIPINAHYPCDYRGISGEFVLAHQVHRNEGALEQTSTNVTTAAARRARLRDK